MDPNYLEIANQVIEFIKPVVVPVSVMAEGLATHALWDWLKTKLRHRSTGASEAVQSVEKTPNDADNWDMLKLQLLKALKEDEAFRKELMERLPEQVKQSINHIANVSGTNAKVVQISGSGNNVSA